MRLHVMSVKRRLVVKTLLTSEALEVVCVVFHPVVHEYGLQRILPTSAGVTEVDGRFDPVAHSHVFTKFRPVSQGRPTITTL